MTRCHLTVTLYLADTTRVKIDGVTLDQSQGDELYDPAHPLANKVFENVESTTQAMATGQADAHSVVQAMATAEVALETAVTIRNRVVEAYQELLRMPV